MNLLIVKLVFALIGLDQLIAFRVPAVNFREGVAQNLQKDNPSNAKSISNLTVTRIQLVDYNNPSDLDANGEKCDVSLLFNPKKCDPYFVVSYIGGNATFSTTYQDDGWNDVSHLVFNQNHGTNLTAHAGDLIKVSIEAKDDDFGTDDLIGNFIFTHAAQPNNNALVVKADGGATIRVRFETVRIELAFN